jgi:hypothetical protein
MLVVMSIAAASAQSCTVGSQCSSGWCVNYQCQGGCSLDYQCPSGQYCNNANAQCTAQGGYGANCNNNGTPDGLACLSGVCMNGSCTDGAAIVKGLATGIIVAIVITVVVVVVAIGACVWCCIRQRRSYAAPVMVVQPTAPLMGNQYPNQYQSQV